MKASARMHIKVSPKLLERGASSVSDPPSAFSFSYPHFLRSPADQLFKGVFILCPILHKGIKGF